MRISKSAVSLACLTAAAGCSNLTPPLVTVGPDYKRPEIAETASAMPDAGYALDEKGTNSVFKVAEAEKDPRPVVKAGELGKWWEKFNDPILSSLVETSISNNVSYRMAQERLIEARWSYVAAVGALLPTADFAGTLGMNEHHKDTSTARSSGRNLHNDNFHGGFDASWEIDIFGGNRRATEAARAQLAGAFASADDALVSLTAEVGTDYISLRTAQKRIVVARENLALQQETYDILKSRFDSGIGDELAVNQAKYNVEQTRATIPSLLSQEEALKNAIAILAGSMPGAVHETLKPLTDRDWLIEPVRVEGVPLNVIRARPDIRAAELRLEAQVAAVGVAKSVLFPKFFVSGELGLDSVKADQFFHRGALYGSIGPSFSWPIFRGGSVYADFKAEEAKMDEAMLAYELAIEQAYAEVRNAYSSYTQECHRYKALQGAVKAASDAVAISRDLYKNGLADFNNVLDAERSLLSLQDSLKVSCGQITLDQIALYKALGGGLAVAGEDAKAK